MRRAQPRERGRVERHVVAPAAADLRTTAEVAPARLAGLSAELHPTIIPDPREELYLSAIGRADATSDVLRATTRTSAETTSGEN
jgi:hypothetical protein